MSTDAWFRDFERSEAQRLDRLDQTREYLAEWRQVCQAKDAGIHFTPTEYRAGVGWRVEHWWRFEHREKLSAWDGEYIHAWVVDLLELHGYAQHWPFRSWSDPDQQRAHTAELFREGRLAGSIDP